MKGVNDGGPPDFNKGMANDNELSYIQNPIIIKLFHLIGKPYYSRIEDHISEETNAFDGLTIPSMGSPARSSPHSQGSEVNERFSRKVFVGGLPPDIDEGMPNIRVANDSHNM